MRLPDSDRDKLLPGISEEEFLGAAREYIKAAYPNPHRKGCPGRDRLRILARRKQTPLNEELNHIATCSPCFVEYHEIRKTRERGRALLFRTAAAAAATAAVFSGIFFLRHHPTTVAHMPAHSVETAEGTRQKRTIDLRPYEKVRGERQNTQLRSAGPVIFQRSNLDLTIQLPIGSEEGRYVIDLINSSGVLQFEVLGDAVIKDYITTAQVVFDLRNLLPGQFTLTIRRTTRFAATSYPVEIK
jgi:hypothetical protein